MRRPDTKVHRLPIVGVLGSGSSKNSIASELGAWIARSGYHLLTGGGGGVMWEASRGFVEVSPRLGYCIGVIPAGQSVPPFRPKDGYPNSFVELPIYSPLGSWDPDRPTAFSRNHINVLTADVLVILPGSVGTRNEAEIAAELGAKAVLLGSASDFKRFPPLPRVERLGEAQDFVKRNSK